MKLAVCGLGKVGKPLLDMLRETEHECVGFDVNPALTEVSADTAVRRSEAVIVIVPTPSLDDGSFDNQYVRAALHRFHACAVGQGKHEYVYIVTSTVTPGSCDEFRKIVGDNIAYNPLFIRLEEIERDLRNPAFILVGHSHYSVGNRMLELWGWDRFRIKRMSLIEAELAKITLNCALTMKISLANQLHLVAQKLGANSEIIMDAVGSDPRIGNEYLKPGWPYGGPCLPRDNRMFRFVAEREGIVAPLSEAADLVNAMVMAANVRPSDQ